MSEQPARAKPDPKLRPRDPVDALQERAPWRPLEVSVEDMGAIQALYRGDAQEHQQRRALEFILQLCHNGGAHYFPGEGGRRDTDFALGRAFVGLQLKRIIQLKITRGGEHG